MDINDVKMDTAYLFKRVPFAAMSINQFANIASRKSFGWEDTWLALLRRCVLSATSSKKLTTFYRIEESTARESQNILHNTLTHLTMTYPGFLEDRKDAKTSAQSIDPLCYERYA